MLEVEQKFPLRQLDADVPAQEIEQRLADLGATFGETVAQADCYYAHPCRDFARTDEALRIRRVGPENFITYKGPKLDRETKTRREIELPLAADDSGAAEFASLLEALGFREVATVRKQRRTGHLHWEDQQVEIALDDVEGVGKYLELELLVEEHELDAARQCLKQLAEHLQLQTTECRSYLELLLSGTS